MSNVRRSLLSVIGILFVFCITVVSFAQQDQQSDSVPIDSQVKQDPLKEINETLKELSDNYHKLDKQIGDLNTKVTFLLWAFGLFFTVIVLPVIVKYWRDTLSKQSSTEVVSRVAAEKATKASTENKEESDEELMQRNLRENRPSESKRA